MWNKQGDNVHPWPTPFPIWNQPVVPCPVLTVASWPEYRFLSRQVRLSGIPISWRIFNRFLWSTVKGFGVVNKAEVADLPVSVQKSLVEVWVDHGQPWAQEHSMQQSWEPCWHKSIWRKSSLLPLSLPQNYREGTQPHRSIENWINYLLSTTALQSKTQILPQPVPPIKKLPQVSYPYPSEGRQNDKLQKSNQTDHIDQSLI